MNKKEKSFDQWLKTNPIWEYPEEIKSLDKYVYIRIDSARCYEVEISEIPKKFNKLLGI